MHQKKENPPGFGPDGLGVDAIADSIASTKLTPPAERAHHPITAAALLLPRRAPGHHILELRHNPRHLDRPWLVTFAGVTFDVHEHSLGSMRRFYNVAFHRVQWGRRWTQDDLFALRDKPSQELWQAMIRAATATLRRGDIA